MGALGEYHLKLEMQKHLETNTKKGPASSAPVVVFLFNRPDFTATLRTFIEKAKPGKLFLIADGPRHQADLPLCEASRSVFAEIDWHCEVYRNYADTNLGCYQRVVTGLSWVFSLVDRAIIFEDDMIPDPSLIPFVSQLLDDFRDDETVYTVGGFSTLAYTTSPAASYFFSRYPLTWGWGTWARAWRHFDGQLREWPRMREGKWLEKNLRDPSSIEFYNSIFDAAAAAPVRGRFPTPWSPSLVDAWDFVWTYSIWARDGRCIVPSVNMVTNVGFRSDSTNVKTADNHLALLQAAPMSFPLIPPRSEVIDRRKDARLFSEWQGWRKLTLWQQLRYRLACWPPARNAYHALRKAVRA